MRGGRVIFNSPPGRRDGFLETDEGTWQAVSKRTGSRERKTAFMDYLMLEIGVADASVLVRSPQ